MQRSDTYSDDDSLPIGDAARRLGVSVDTLREWDATGKLPSAYRTPGNQRRYRRADIEALIQPAERAS